MAQIIIAPHYETPKFTSVFLAGGITNCKEWQKAVIEELKFEDISIFNPRQEHFNVSDKNASYKQISWEFEHLEKMDIFSMYFCNNDSDQPICMYELGRNIVRLQNKFPSDWEKRIVISVEAGYRRQTDVLIQTELATQNKVFIDTNVTPDLHAQYIKKAIKSIANKLPSVVPQPKSGKWRKEWLTDSMTGRDGIYRVCSECGYEEDYYSGRKLDYCPRCGSRNEER